MVRWCTNFHNSPNNAHAVPELVLRSRTDRLSIRIDLLLLRRKCNLAHERVVLPRTFCHQVEYIETIREASKSDSYKSDLTEGGKAGRQSNWDSLDLRFEMIVRCVDSAIAYSWSQWTRTSSKLLTRMLAWWDEDSNPLFRFGTDLGRRSIPTIEWLGNPLNGREVFTCLEGTLEIRISGPVCSKKRP